MNSLREICNVTHLNFEGVFSRFPGNERRPLYHLAFTGALAKSTPAEANEKRDWRIWEDLAKSLLRKAFPVLLRRGKYVDLETGREFVFLTNYLEIPALPVAMLYKLRWRIKHYDGTSPNAVKTQRWIGVCTYLMIAIPHKYLKLLGTLLRTSQIPSVYPIDKVTLNEILTENDRRAFMRSDSNQLSSF